MYKRGRKCFGCHKYLTKLSVSHFWHPRQVHTSNGHLWPTRAGWFQGPVSIQRPKSTRCSLGMINWIITIRWFNVALATSSLARFVSCPHEGHLEHDLHILAYFKRRKRRCFVIHARVPFFRFQRRPCTGPNFTNFWMSVKMHQRRSKPTCPPLSVTKFQSLSLWILRMPMTRSQGGLSLGS